MEDEREIEDLCKWMSDAMILAEMVASMEPGDKVGDAHVALAQHVSGFNSRARKGRDHHRPLARTELDRFNSRARKGRDRK